MFFHPERVALAGALTYLALWLVAPLELVFPVSLESLVYVVACYLAFAVGSAVRTSGHIRIARLPVTKSGFSRSLFWACAGLGALGVGLRLYDKYVMRGVSLASTALEARAALTEVQAGPIAAIGGALYALCYVPLIIVWMSQRESHAKASLLHKSVGVALFLLPALDALLLLSRSQMIVALGMMYFAVSCALYGGRPFPPQMRRMAIVGVLTLLTASTLAFGLRLEQMGLQLSDSIVGSAYGYVVTPNAWVLEEMRADSLASRLLASVVPLLQYYLHGLFEFGLLWERPDAQVFTQGTQLFGPYLKAFSVLGLIDPPANPLNQYFRIGVFTSFFGPLWIDFGWVGIPFMTAFGYACKSVAIRARMGRLAAVPLHAYLCVVVFFMPVVNFLVSAQGIYVLTSLTVFWFLARPRTASQRSHRALIGPY